MDTPELVTEIEKDLIDNGIAKIENNQFSGFLKVKKHTTKYILRLESQILEFLTNHEYKCHQLVKTQSGKDYVLFDHQVVHLYKAVEGTLLDVSLVLQDHRLIKTIGSNLGRLDLLLNQTGITEQIQNTPGIQSWELIDSISMIKEYVKYNSPQFGGLLHQLDEILQMVAFDQLPKQLIHRDFHIGNLIQSTDELYLIDFDQTCIEIRLFELCYFLTTSFFKIWWNFGFSEIPMELCRQFQDLALEGYLQVINLTPEEEKYYPIFLQLTLFAFVIYLYNEKAYLDMNRHLELMQQLFNNDDFSIL